MIFPSSFIILEIYASDFCIFWFIGLLRDLVFGLLARPFFLFIVDYMLFLSLLNPSFCLGLFCFTVFS